MKKMILWAALTLITMTNAEASTHINNESIVSKEFNLSGFSGLKNNHAVKIYYTQGNTFSIKAEGSAEQLERLNLEVKDGLLVVSQKDKKSSNEKQMLTLYITSPDMNRLENNGVLNFDTNKLKTGDFHLSSNGVLNLEAQQISCAEATCDLKGVSNLDAHIEGTKLKMNDSGTTNGELVVNADKLEINSSGVDNIEVNYKGKEVSVIKSGVGTISLQVDCEKLDATNSGVGKIVLSGTADDTSIKNTGVTKIDVSKLNQF
ncbi:MAG: DUF2807 domain-containing protein [Bacteroidaceae bacterium]|nr:DUF2807 domain-containing protein [Bacteroidaceae bacterium]